MMLGTCYLSLAPSRSFFRSVRSFRPLLRLSIKAPARRALEGGGALGAEPAAAAPERGAAGRPAERGGAPGSAARL